MYAKMKMINEKYYTQKKQKSKSKSLSCDISKFVVHFKYLTLHIETNGA